MKKAFFYILVLFLFIQCKSVKKQYFYNEGRVFGTFYHITYESPKGENLHADVEKRFAEFDLSLSTFNPASVISRINTNDFKVTTDRYFEEMYLMAHQVSEKTGGAFDITVAPLVNAWGFGYGNHDHLVKPDIDTIMPLIGYNKIKLENHQLIKQNPKIRLDASAIAKGQASDVIAELLDDAGCENYLVEIGGEIRCKGLNPQGEKWHIGIDKPIDDPTGENIEVQSVVAISDVGLATSGNYRQFYFKDGKKFAHTIDPHSGAPVVHNLLSATVIAPTCMQADAYATAFMVLGEEKSIRLCESVPDMECYLIYQDKNGTNKIAQTKGFNQYLEK